MKIAIIGGGIAGLSAAVALKQKGFSVHVYERAPELNEVGAGILLWSCMKQIFEELELGEAFRQFSNPLSHFNLANNLLEKVISTPNDLGVIFYSIHRADLIRVLKTGITEEEYTCNCRIETLTMNNDGVTIEINGKLFTYDLVVASDGIKSRLRNQWIPEVAVNKTGHIGWRGVTELELSNDFHQEVFELWGLNKRFGIFHKQGKEYYWYACVWEKEVSNSKLSKDEVCRLFADFHPSVQPLIQNSSNFIQTEVKHIPFHKNSWFRDRIVFVGDSIHACTPDLAQGACQAIISGYQLAKSLDEMSFDLQLALTDYETSRRKKIKNISNTSYRLGRFGHQRKEWQYKLMFSIMRLLPFYIRYKFKKLNTI